MENPKEPPAAYGGGIYAENVASLYIQDCVISGNEAFYGGGIATKAYSSKLPTALYIDRSNITKNSVNNGYGGGVHDEGGYARIRDSVIDSNIARTGYALSVGMMTELFDTHVTNNRDIDGGSSAAIDISVRSDFTMTNGTLDNYGNDLDVAGGNATLVCVDFNENGIHVEGEGKVTVVNCTTPSA